MTDQPRLYPNSDAEAVVAYLRAHPTSSPSTTSC
jgi:hypothetical protein